MDSSISLNTKEKVLEIKPLIENAFGNILGYQELENMLAICTIVTFSTNDMVFQQGDKAKGIYLIIKGKVDLIARTLGKGITKIETCLAGDFLGETSFFLNEPDSISAIAQEEVKCLFLPPTYFELMAAFSPEAKYKVINAIGHQVCHDSFQSKLLHIYNLDTLCGKGSRKTQMPTSPSGIIMILAIIVLANIRILARNYRKEKILMLYHH